MIPPRGSLAVMVLRQAQDEREWLAALTPFDCGWRRAQDRLRHDAAASAQGSLAVMVLRQAQDER